MLNLASAIDCTNSGMILPKHLKIGMILAQGNQVYLVTDIGDKYVFFIRKYFDMDTKRVEAELTYTLIAHISLYNEVTGQSFDELLLRE